MRPASHHDPARMQAVQAPVIPIIGALIREHPGTISLGQGVVYYGPPPQARAKVQEFFADPENNKYGSVRGIEPLLAALQAKLTAENGIALDTGAGRALVVTAGGNMAFVNAVLALTDPGDEVIIQTPYYFNHEMAIAIAGCRAVEVQTDENYQLRPAAIRAAISERTRAVVTISPNNPTGAVYPESALREVNEICRDRGVYHIHDEAYEYFVYGGAKHVSPGAFAGAEPHTISLFSLSKSYGFASWRIGYMVIPEHLLESVMKIQDTNLICPPVISQYAALGALEAGASYCRRHLQEIEQARDVVLDELEAIGTVCTVPRTEGAFYFHLRLDCQLDPLEFARRLIREHGVALIPGTAFGISGCTLRVAYGALKKDTAAAGIQRFVRGVKAILKL